MVVDAQDVSATPAQGMLDATDVEDVELPVALAVLALLLPELQAPPRSPQIDSATHARFTSPSLIEIGQASNVSGLQRFRPTRVERLLVPPHQRIVRGVTPAKHCPARFRVL